jgi:hypothetical protein
MLPASRIAPVVPPVMAEAASAGWIRAFSTASKSMPLRQPNGRTMKARRSGQPLHERAEVGRVHLQAGGPADL